MSDSENEEIISGTKKSRAILSSDEDSDVEDGASIKNNSLLNWSDSKIDHSNSIELTDDEDDIIEDSLRSDNGVIEDSFQHSASNSFKSKQMAESSFVAARSPMPEIESSDSSDDESVKIIENRETIQIESSSDDESVQPIPKTEVTTPIPFKSNISQLNTTKFVQPTLPSLIKSAPALTTKRLVTPDEYQAQRKRVETLEQSLLQTKNAIRTIKLDTLPDKGAMLGKKERSLEDMVNSARKVLESMTINTNTDQLKPQINWDDIQAGVSGVVPKAFGKKAMERFNIEKEMTMETLGHLHKSLENCPKESHQADPPRGLKVELMTHQKTALAWLLWREKQKPPGGILGDDMGLGKTLTMISLVAKSNELEEDVDVEEEKENLRTKKIKGGTLIVCPASLLNQWSGEVESKTQYGLISVEHYHGPKRETNARRLADHNMVITTYSLVMGDFANKGPLHRIKWRRIILDEAHQIRNYKSRTSEAVCELSAKSRWALSGTPVHNKELDMFALLKFLRCSPFDNLAVWKHWMNDKSSGGQERLNTVLSSIMLRRTKAELMGSGSLKALPSRSWELIEVKLDKEELEVYQRVLIFSRTLFAQFLHQRAMKNQDAYDMSYAGSRPEANSEYFKMRNKLLKLNKVKDVSQHEILVLLLRLRQICCHPSLITAMLEGNEDLGDSDDVEEREEINLLEQLNNMNLDESLNENYENVASGAAEAKPNMKEAAKGFLNPSHPVFDKERKSSKIKKLIELLKEKVPRKDKAIVISQWTTLLSLIAIHLKEEGLIYGELNGSVPVHKRMDIVDDFNNPKSSTRILLLSLTAGGVGLNLVGANHLFLMDLHWNPQLENQAQDRIYRVGQAKPIFVYKFMADDTIEQRIKSLQDNKLAIADAMLTGSKQVVQSKLSLNDLKMLFGF